MWMFVHLIHLALSSATLSNKIFCGSFWLKVLFLCACHISKMNFIPQPQKQKSGRRHTKCSSSLCEWLGTQPIWCCPLRPLQMRYFVVHFDQKSCYFCACHKNKMNFIPQPHEQKSCRRQPQCSSTVFKCLCTWAIWCCPLQPFQMRYFVVCSLIF